jgi:excisionase family DNA binding protein
MHDSAIRSSDSQVRAAEPLAATTPISLRVSDVAALWGVGERFVWQKVLSGELASFKLGTRRLVRYEAAKAYIDAIADEERGLRDRLAEAV